MEPCRLLIAMAYMLTEGFKWIQFDATAAEVEQLLVAEFYIWEHGSGDQDISTEEYHVPTHIQEHIDYVTPGSRLRQRSSMAAGLDNQRRQPLITKLPGFPHPNSTTCDIYVTAECTRGMIFCTFFEFTSECCTAVQYSIPNATTAEPGNELGIFESLDVHYSRHDLDIYFSTLYP